MSQPYPLPRGAAVLNQVAAFIGRFVAFPDPHCLTAVTLWAAHTHAPTNTFYVTPRLVLDSAEPGSGKTRVLELLALLVLRPEMTISATVAAIFRMLGEQPYTLLFDEVDAIFNPKNGGNYEDLRALLNAGYKQGATIARCVGDAKAMKVERFKVFAPVALAGIAGRMPATITTRSVTIHMRRRGPGERVEPFRERDAGEQAEPLRDSLSEWVRDVADTLTEARPVMPDGVEDRPAEVWEALLAVADQAGGDWPDRARKACTHFTRSADTADTSIGVRLLADLRRLYPDGTNEMTTADIVKKLVGIDEAPWADLWGKPLDSNRLARELARYGVRPRQYRDEHGAKCRGYVTYPTDKTNDGPAQAGLADAWARYLDSAGTPGTGGTSQVSAVPGVPAVPPESGPRAPTRWRISGRPLDQDHEEAS